VSGGVATLTTSSLPAGNYTITSTYQGDANYGASTSTPVTLTIGRRTGPGGAAALTVTVGDVSRLYGQGNPAFGYTVMGALVNGDTYTTAVTGVPVYSTTATSVAPAGTYPISVAGLNSNNYVIAFVNGTLTVTVPVGGTTTSVPVVAVGPTTPTAGQPVTLTATVPTTGTTVPTGTVTFYYNGNPIGTGTLDSNGVATLTTSTLPVGTGTITVGYSGDSNYASSISLPRPITVAAAPVLDFTLTLTSAQSQTVISGQAAPYTVRVAPTNGTYPGVVTFTATGLPPGATVTFSPATVAANGGPVSVNLSIKTSSIVGMNKLERNAASIALGLLLLPLAGAKRMRRSARAGGRYLFMMLVLLAGAVVTTGLTGCGSHNGFFGHAPQTYNITITATSGNLQHSVNATLNVQ
jgi:hypothetical protein